jgi:lysophospholipase L1-like esterase
MHPAAAVNTAVHPAIRPDYSPEQRAAWMKRHEEFTGLARQGGVDVAFFGDSLTDYWRERGRASWDRYFAPLRAANFGISGDRTQQVLWRIDRGELDGIEPKVVVLLIGSNNLTPGLGENSLTPKNTPAETAAGVAAIVDVLRRRLPRCRILLHAILPRDNPADPIRHEVTETNVALARLADGTSVRFVDLGSRFLSPDGTISRDIMPDLLHLNTAGYALWADALHPPLTELLA